MFTNLNAATWGEVSKAKDKGLFDFDLFFTEDEVLDLSVSIFGFLNSAIIYKLLLGSADQSNP